MIEISLTILPILIADIINPVLFAFMVYAAGSVRPVLNSSAVLLGHTLAYFSAGVVIALGFDRIAEYLASPDTIDYILGLIVGILLLWLAFNVSNATSQKRNENEGPITPLKAFGMGAIINFIGIPFALPYFAVIDQVLKADLTTNEALVILSGYNLLYALPFLIVPALVVFIGKRSNKVLQHINGKLDQISAIIMPVLLGMVGLALVADAALYFITDKGLF